MDVQSPHQAVSYLKTSSYHPVKSVEQDQTKSNDSYQVCPMQNLPVGRWLWMYRAWYHHRSEQSAASRVTTHAHCGPEPSAGNHAIVNQSANTASGVNLYRFFCVSVFLYYYSLSLSLHPKVKYSYF